MVHPRRPIVIRLIRRPRWASTLIMPVKPLPPWSQWRQACPTVCWAPLARPASMRINETRALRRPDQAWTVREVDRAWPTQVDAVAVDTRSMQVISQANFTDFPLVVKLIRWGIDAHMGILFGWINQVVLVLFGLSLTGMVVQGYTMWWRRRPAPGAHVATLTAAWRRVPAAGRVVLLVVAVALDWSLPVMGASFAVFLVVDVV